MPSAVKVAPHRDRAIMYDYPFQGARITYTRGELLLTAPPGASVARSPVQLHGLRRGSLFRCWTSAEIAYFFGQAITRYYAIPFILADASHLATLKRRGAAFGVRVKFSPGWLTHGSIQTFMFRDGLLERHDYVATAIGRFATASHFSSNYRSVNGLMLAGTRRVVQRVFGVVTPITLLEAELSDFALFLKTGADGIASPAQSEK
jgi:hypothetical protein